jgi:hypothetical protein
VEFDEQLTHTLESIADRLRDGVAQHLRSAGGDLAALVSSELAAIRAARDAAAAERDTAAAERDVAAAERDAAAAERNAALAQRDAALAQCDAATAERDVANAERDQSNAERDAARSAEQDGRAEQAAHAATAPATRESSVHSLAEHVRAIDAARTLSEVLDALVRCAGEHVPRTGVLIVRGGRFHGWRFAGFDPAPDRDAPIDLSPADAGIVADAAQRAAVVDNADAERIGDAAPRPPSFAEVSPGGRVLAAPLIVGGEAVAVLYADGERENLEPGAGDRELLEILCRHASRCLEALTAMKAARALTTAAPPLSADAAFASVDAAARESSANAFESARRYARLLVSEIRLYHEAQVVAGRRDRDLAIRLGGEIARARALYEQRVPLDVRRQTDFVHEELVRTLADGDATLLDMGT